MIFNSLEFLIFFIIFIIVWTFVKKKDNSRWIAIVLFSLVFYGWWDWRYIILLIFTGTLDFFCAILIEKYNKFSRSILIVSILCNIGVLGYFKYFYFLAANFNFLFGYFHITQYEFRLQNIILPLGISFYTFQSISYTVDVYRKELKPTYNIFHFFSAITFFPHLVAGPIMRSAKLLPQLLTYKSPNSQEKWWALNQIVHGFFKKMVIADNLAFCVNESFAGRVGTNNFLNWSAIVFMFAMQIYCDFSGYSDIARGTAKLLGYDFSINFNHPYFSTSLREFWTRWHISLSSWFRDYVFIPLGGSRTKNILLYRNLFLTMTLSGLWHGAAWTYIAWGVYHGIIQIFERITKWPDKLKVNKIGYFVAWLLVFTQVLLGWIFFRATDIRQAFNIISYFGVFSHQFDISKVALFFVFLGVIHEIYRFIIETGKNTSRNSFVPLFDFIILVITSVACILLRGPGNTFIYFQF